MKGLKRISALFFAVVVMSAVFSGCSARNEGNGNEMPVFTSFRDIPGVTREEITAAEELQSRVDSFVYASNYSTEAFQGDDGIVRGFAALFCEWLSELFGIPFIPRIAEWDELIEGLEDGSVDFTGELTANDERRLKYLMTDDIVQRQIIVVRLDNDVPLQAIAQTRPLRYAFLDGTTTTDDVYRVEKNEFEAFFVDDYPQAYAMLASGEVDAFFDESPAEAAFDFSGEVIVSTFLPIIYSPVSLSTQNRDLWPIINIMDKALENGAIYYLAELYNQGRQDYLSHKLFMLLTDTEREYVKNNPVVFYAAETTNYPVSFYDTRTGQWEGIAIDLINEMERITGIEFRRLNDENAYWPELLGMLEVGSVSMITELIPTAERTNGFIWADEKYKRSHFALISKSDFRNININELLYVKIGAARNTAYSDTFKSWFPNHRSIIDYDSTYSAFNALENGEIDMVITGEHQLLILTNYRELVGYKANYIFDYYYDSTFGFNIDEPVLASIVTKAMRLAGAEGVAGHWLRKTYDYRVRLQQERIPYMIGLGMLSVGLVFSIILMIKKRREGLRLETLVDIRTKELWEKGEQLMEAVETAQHSNRAKTEFLASMSHEIRTPMNAIMGMSAILEHERLTAAQMNYVKDISASAQSLLGIINDILDMSKIEAGRLELNPVDYCFNKFMDNIVSMFTYISENKGLRFITELGGNIPGCLYGDDMRLRQVLTNICGNAVKFTEKGYVKLTVDTVGDRLVFTVEDSGAGIREEDLSRLFIAFERIDNVKHRNVVGTGLGLTICKSFVEMMGGEISVRSRFGHGTAFTVAIPVIEGDADKIPERKDVLTELHISAPDAKILIVDDNEFNLKVASGLLSFMDIRAETADSGAKAIARVKENDYDIIYMDHMMPEMDGIEAAGEIRKLGGKYEKLTIIALTANAVKGAREMFLDNGFNDFISKPIDANELRRTAQRYLPPGKIRTDAVNQKPNADKEERLRRKSIAIFVKENQRTYENITDALDSGDVKTAHRIAHTLKGGAGYLGKNGLRDAAFSLEESLGNGTGYTSGQLAAVKQELEKALIELEPVFKEAESEKPAAAEIGDAELASLLEELEPLLAKGDFGAASYAEKLRMTAGTEKLAERVDDYDFEGALQLLKEIKGK